MPTASGAVLVAVLSNPPLTDGTRTLSRVSLAAELLGYSQVVVVNLFSLPSHSTGAIDKLGATATGWEAAREPLEQGLMSGFGVLLGYGVTTPTGLARAHFREQVSWVNTRIEAFALPAWQVGDQPRHPSRWQRWTSRQHPELPFPEAVARSLVQVRVEVLDAPTRFGRETRAARHIVEPTGGSKDGAGPCTSAS